MTNVIDINAPRPLTKAEKLDLYCEALMDGKSKAEAYVIAGYSSNGARNNAQKFHRENAQYILKYQAEKITEDVPMALSVIRQIASDPEEKGGIRLKAAQDLLDRAGLGAKQKVELTVSDPNEMSTEELMNEIKRLVNDTPDLAEVLNFKESVGE